MKGKTSGLIWTFLIETIVICHRQMSADRTEHLSTKFKCSLFIKSREEEFYFQKTWPRSLDQSREKSFAEKYSYGVKKNSPIEFEIRFNILNQMF